MDFASPTHDLPEYSPLLRRISRERTMAAAMKEKNEGVSSAVGEARA